MSYSYDTKTNNFFKVYSPEELTEIVKESVEFYHNQYEEAITEIKKTKEELRQEIKKEYENELNNLREWQRLTLIHFNSQQEQEAYDNFWKTHNEKHYGTKPRKYGLGNLILYPFGSGIGNGLTVECPECHEKKDITDYTCW